MDWRTLIDWQWARDARVDALERKIRRLEAGLEERAPVRGQSPAGPTAELPWEWEFLSPAQRERWKREGKAPRDW